MSLAVMQFVDEQTVAAEKNQASNMFPSDGTERLRERHALEAPLIARAMRDEAFRKRLLADPKGVLQHELSCVAGKSLRFPADFEIRVVEEAPRVAYLVLPAPVQTGAESYLLSDADLDPRGGVVYYCSTVGCKPGFSC